MLDGIVVDVSELFVQVLFVSDRMFVKPFLPYRLEASVLSACRLFKVVVIFRLAMFGEVSFDCRDDCGVVCCVPGRDNHMEMVGQDDDGIDTIVKSLFAVCKYLAQEMDIVDENRIAPVCHYGEIVAIVIEEYPSVICHIRS